MGKNSLPCGSHRARLCDHHEKVDYDEDNSSKVVSKVNAINMEEVVAQARSRPSLVPRTSSHHMTHAVLSPSDPANILERQMLKALFAQGSLFRYQSRSGRTTFLQLLFLAYIRTIILVLLYNARQNFNFPDSPRKSREGEGRCHASFCKPTFG